MNPNADLCRHSKLIVVDRAVCRSLGFSVQAGPIFSHDILHNKASIHQDDIFAQSLIGAELASRKQLTNSLINLNGVCQRILDAEGMFRYTGCHLVL